MSSRKQAGFSLLELLVVVVIFLVLAAGALAVLNVAQQRHQAETQSLDTFQSARLGLDEVIRDVSVAGYPPQSFFWTLPLTSTLYTDSPFAWSPGYPAATCTIGVNCTTATPGLLSPGPFDLIVEADIDPQVNTDVEWTRYQLPAGTTTLLRTSVPKVAPADPDAITAPLLVPYITNVMNNASPAQIAQLTAMYPNLFPGGNPVPMFTYCAAATAAQACPPPATPRNIREVRVTLIVMAQLPDPRTGQPRVVTLTGQVRRTNP